MGYSFIESKLRTRYLPIYRIGSHAQSSDVRETRRNNEINKRLKLSKQLKLNENSKVMKVPFVRQTRVLSN